ncbi:DUF1772 domain-containing protein [Verrucomicrobium spinosum]|uniref:DUF1772 domain-containing protein n=1 Tax=Verrucomicrobium spinosum TaxID=2736 RepID=UPI0009463E58|nr:DUF1772 domain-containing protein [Verrucomicrobium spinosum]
MQKPARWKHAVPYGLGALWKGSLGGRPAACASPLADWEEVRDRWLWYHHVRAIAETAGFLLLLGAAFCYVGNR